MFESFQKKTPRGGLLNMSIRHHPIMTVPPPYIKKREAPNVDTPVVSDKKDVVE